ncbi:MAG: T9SS type A sorting domain-containing protein, partial [Bacteroidota bacterium]|nr:T9SS type A sorting domain-containing protein [Bacteroidota bacterium]
MNKLYTLAGIIGISFCFFSFSTNPPDGNTGAPGDMFCTQCHNQTNPTQNGTLTLEGFPDVITPNETYSLKISNRVTEGTAVRGGFQMTVLGPFNTRAGDFLSPSTSSVVSISGGRQYWEHNPALEYPDSNVVSWTVLWKAPEMVSGSVITWYASGNIANGNFQNTGDRIIGANGNGTVVLAATNDMTANQTVLYPNPGTDEFNIRINDAFITDGRVSFIDTNGREAGSAVINDGRIVVPVIPAGIYILHVKDGSRVH